MSYRNIIVDGKRYQYIVGDIFVKIRGVGAWPKQEVGIEIDRDGENDGVGTVEVYPSHIAQWIRKKY